MDSNAKLNTLMFGWEFPPHISGGLGTACYGLTRALAAVGNVRTTFVLPKLYGDEDTRYAILRAPIQDPTVTCGHGIPPAYSGEIVELSQWFAASTQSMLNDLPVPDVVHAHDWLTADAALVAKQVFNKPMVLHIHSTEFDRSGRHPNERILAIESRALANADTILAVSDRTRRQLVQKYSVNVKRIEVVHNGIDFASVALKRYRNTASPLICFLGRVTHQKGPAYFLRAAAIALDVNPALKFILAGDGDLLSEMKLLAKKLGIFERVVFPGFLNKEEIDHLFRHANALVIPSVSEPFGIVALEAASAGVPIIISKNAGVTEVLSNVISVDHTDVHSIAKSMLDIISDETLALKLSENSRSEIQLLSWQNTASRVLETYRDLCGVDR